MFVVTGGAGFIGSNVVAALCERGQEVVVCDWLGKDERWRNLAKHNITDVIRPENLIAWLEGRRRKPLTIVHMGAVSATTETDVDLIVERNLRSTLDLIQWCTDARVPLIYASSAATYGNGEQGFDDEFSSAALGRLRPLNAYGWSKLFVDRHIARLSETRAALPPQWVGLRFFNVYGPNEYHKGDMRSVIARNHPELRAGAKLRLFRSYRPEYRDGEQKRDFIYVGDCVDVILWFLDDSRRSGLFNLGTGQARTWMDLAHAMHSALGIQRDVELIEMPVPLREKYQYFTEARMDRLRDAGYVRPFTSLEDGVRAYVTGYLDRRDDPYR